MGLPVLPPGNIVRSVVRVPDSGWNTSLPSRLLDISRYSSVAAAVNVGQNLLSQQSPESSTSSERNTASKNTDEHHGNNKLEAIQTPSAVKINGSQKKPDLRATTSARTLPTNNTDAHPACVLRKLPPNIVKKVRTEGSAFTTARSSSSYERKRQRPEDLQEGVVVVKSPSSKIHKTAELAQSKTNKQDISYRVDEGTVVLIPARIYLPSSSLVQQNSVQLQQMEQPLSSGTSGSSETGNVQCKWEGKESAAALYSGSKVRSVSTGLQTEQNYGHMLSKLCQENKELKLKNTDLQQRLTAFQNIFKDKEKLKKLIRVIYAHSLSNKCHALQEKV